MSIPKVCIISSELQMIFVFEISTVNRVQGATNISPILCTYYNTQAGTRSYIYLYASACINIDSIQV